MIENKLLKNKLSISIHWPVRSIYGLAILCPGFLDSKDYSHLKILAEELADIGYVAVRFDPTGTWSSLKEISEYKISNYLRDIKLIIDSMTAKKSFHDIVLIGHSLGGMIALFYAFIYGRITKVINIMSPYKYVRSSNKQKQEKWKQKKYKRSLRDLPENPNVTKEFTVPYSFLQDTRQYDALDVIGNIDLPLLFIAGNKDKIIPVEDVKKIYNYANQPKKFIALKEIGHDYRRNEKDIRLVNNEIIKFLINES